MRTSSRLSGLIFTVIIIFDLLVQVPAWGQGADGWSFVITPQAWLSHIAENGFVSASGFSRSASGFGPITDPNGTILARVFEDQDSRPVDDLDPQWGLQLAAQKGRWTLAGSFQYVNFETVTDVVYKPSNNLPIGFVFNSLFPGDRAAQEFVNTTRIDLDFAVSYLFPDIVHNRLDLSVGGGLKFIYASASRNYENLSPFLSEVGALLPTFLGSPGSGLYLVCKRDDCSDQSFKDRVKTKAWLYGVTIPTSTVFHLTRDSRWLLPFSITPFIGAETRDDQNVVYDLNCPARFDFNQFPLGGCTVKRLDGTTFAYGVTSDATVRWIVNETLSVYAGMRVQFIKGHEKYLAYGPLVGMSVRFGGK